MKTVLTTVILAVAACGGAPKGSSTSPDDTDSRNRGMSHMGGDHQMGRTGHMGKAEHGEAGMPPQLAKFHHTLAPRWHAAQGPQRMADTCAALPEFHRDAEAIAAAEAPPQGDAVAWSTGGKKLTEAVAALGATCRSKDGDAFEPAFARVHATFHGLIEAVGGHGEDGEGVHDGDDDDGDHGDGDHGDGHDEHP